MFKRNEVEIIERYINGEADINERDWVESQFLNGEENLSLHNHLKNDWENMLSDSPSAEKDLNHLLDRVHHIIRKNETLVRNKPLNKFIQVYMKAAAMLLIPVLLATSIIFSNILKNEAVTADLEVSPSIYAPMGSRVSFNLPDGSKGMLNSGSRLSYSLPFSKNRKVSLEGEAWFEVKHDTVHPFEISTGNSTLRVLGTRFNVSAYQVEKYVEVVLLDGKVEFRDNNTDDKIIMIPSERLVFKNANISKTITDPAKYNAWTEGKLVFRGDPMAEVARRLERWYNIEVELADKALEKYSFRGTFHDDKIEEVLRYLSMTSPIKYKITHGTLLSDGTCQREKVTIYIKK